MNRRALVKRAARRLGFDVVRYPGPATSSGRRMLRMNRYGVDLVVDVGANAGQYGTGLRELGYKGDLLSIEPLPEAYAALQQAAGADARWHTMSCAVGTSTGTATLHVAENSVSSSMLPMLPSHVAAAPASRVVGTIEVPVRRLDSILEGATATSKAFVKVDTQGSERDVLESAGAALDKVVGVQVEMSLVALYSGAPTMAELVEWLERRGLWLADIEPEFNDPLTGRLLQVNGLFFRPGPEGDLYA